MKRGLSFYSFAQDVSLREAALEAKAAGYDGVELVVSENGELNMKTTDRELIQIRAMLSDMGLEAPSVGAWNIWEHNLAGDDAHHAAYARDIVKKQIECAHALGADTVLVVPGWVGTPFAQGLVRYDRAYDNAQRALSALAPVAKAANVVMGVENVWNKFLLSPVETARFLDEIGSPFVGAYFDVGNIIYIGYPDQWIEILGKRIHKLHFCDYRFEQAGMGAFVDLMAGDVDFDAVMKAVREVGYDDWATVEYLPNYKRFPYQAVKNALASLDVILALG